MDVPRVSPDQRPRLAGLSRVRRGAAVTARVDAEAGSSFAGDPGGSFRQRGDRGCCAKRLGRSDQRTVGAASHRSLGAGLFRRSVGCLAPAVVAQRLSGGSFGGEELAY